MGFLPIRDPGVCNFMSEDFARAVTEGRYAKWKANIDKTESEFIERLRAGQYDALSRTPMFNLGTQRPFGPSAETVRVDKTTETKMEDFRLSSLAKSIHSKMKVYGTSCLNAPCVKFQWSLERAGRLGGQRFGHATMFSMAVERDGRLDKEHLLFMDPNAGIIKIKNNEESIKQFLETVDTKLYGSMRIRSASVSDVQNLKLPQKETPAWTELDDKIKTYRVPDKESNYSLCKLCQLDNYLQTQIARLESKSIWDRLSRRVDTDREAKLNYLQSQRKHLHSEYKKTTPGSESSDRAADKLFKSMMDTLERSTELSARRGFKESTAAKKFKKFKKQYEQNLDGIQPERTEPDPTPVVMTPLTEEVPAQNKERDNDSAPECPM